MKIRTTIHFAAAIAAGLTLITQADAQFQARGEDGLYASPKVRQMLNEQKAKAHATLPGRTENAAAPSKSRAPVSYQASGEDGIYASPSLRVILKEQKARAASASDTGGPVSYAARGEDGIYASPRLRQIIREQGAHFQIAPLK